MEIAGMNFIDAFGAPEFFCTDMKLEDAEPGLVRVRMICHEAGEAILRCTLLLPEKVVLSNLARTTEFLKADASVN